MRKRTQKKFKDNAKGITLVALVITIIILLILAGVSIGMVFDGEGLFSRTEGAALEHRGGKVEDEVVMWKNDKNIAKYTGDSSLSKDELIDAQLAKGLLTEEEAVQARTSGSVKIGTKIIDYGNRVMSNEKVYPISFNNDENIDCAIITIDVGYTLVEYKEKVNALSDEEINQVLDKQFKAILENKNENTEYLISIIERYDGTNADEICEAMMSEEGLDDTFGLDYKHFCAFGLDLEFFVQISGWSFVLNRGSLLRCRR